MINLSILKIGNWFEILKTCAGHLFVDQMEHACWSHPAPELQLETSVLQHQVGLNGLYPKNNMPGSERGQRCKDEWNKFSAFRKFYVWCRRQTIRKASQNTTVCCWYREENQALPDTELVLSERNLGRLSGGGGTRSGCVLWFPNRRDHRRRVWFTPGGKAFIWLNHKVKTFLTNDRFLGRGKQFLPV